MNWRDLAVVAILLGEFVGFGLAAVVIYRLMLQIGALKGTVETQATTLDMLHELNKTALEMAKSFDPKKFADAANTYQELVDQNAKALVEEARREFDRARPPAAGAAGDALERLARHYQGALRVGLGLLAFIPKNQRGAAIMTTDVPQEFKDIYLRIADAAPDWSAALLLMNLARVTLKADAPVSPLATR
jgi:hypothetical protein